MQHEPDGSQDRVWACPRLAPGQFGFQAAIGTHAGLAEFPLV